MSESTKTLVHLVRHGLVENPTGVLYGRLPDFHLSEVGRQMADLVASAVKDWDIVHLRCSPLERAQETMTPIAANFDVPVITDGRVIEAENYLQGRRFDGSKNSAFTNPRYWLYFRNPFKPTWGEPYTEIATRMRVAIHDAAEQAEGHEALVVSHQLPIWIARLDVEGRRFAHDPRKRQCSLASITTFILRDGRITGIEYREPAAELLPDHRSKKFVAGA
ncbi:histidine phosphatase family protein [Microlunatus sp. Gsoil 973]|jgi:broad specificity phosphatase PhoE|uniref:histidine phosphatase family protein n=1 Tax=Microlunatus sp. Gsoil 973 TaxID=2672569 RepID=UPI0012B4E543|nr:histidine phosphatase family protein [Microlunatus sp. Gsoil 973]QGN33805.1 histidine phosphatase family protein [Microlunatus sp. Gsoil 973]